MLGSRSSLHLHDNTKEVDTVTPAEQTEEPHPDQDQAEGGREGGTKRENHTLCLTCEQGHFVEGALQLPHEDVHEAVFGQMSRLFGALVVNHHFLLPAQFHLHTGQRTRKREGGEWMEVTEGVGRLVPTTNKG